MQLQPQPSDAEPDENWHGSPVDEEAEALAAAEGLADIAAGRVISGEAIKRWLRSWGTANELPPPQIGD